MRETAIPKDTSLIAARLGLMERPALVWAGVVCVCDWVELLLRGTMVGEAGMVGFAGAVSIPQKCWMQE